MPPKKMSDFRTHVLLGSAATYRVVELDGAHAVVQAVDVPGLAAGTRMRITREAVERMAAVERPAFVPPSPRFSRLFA